MIDSLLRLHDDPEKLTETVEYLNQRKNIWQVKILASPLWRRPFGWIYPAPWMDADFDL
ncbi:hypothetical protein GCM10007853_08010 [Algimonas ampicilliniresistens]|uniref:Uncharacterized protein n=2 Tax=Algimonas ampicilliniresistens TaxID=1298735 RepID=A0ABQ5V9C4_9PROT|nr:hypothetical protein GCM10007853_08010 [Algimonas ampicilliniresistens]